LLLRHDAPLNDLHPDWLHVPNLSDVSARQVAANKLLDADCRRVL